MRPCATLAVPDKRNARHFSVRHLAPFDSMATE